MFYYEIILYPLFLLAILFSGYAQFKVSRTFNKYANYNVGMGKTASEVAESILRSHGITDVRIEQVRGHLTDHYDPRHKVLRLSESVYNSSSAAAIGVAAHECGHAVQHSERYFPVLLRSALVPVTNIASKLSWLVIISGLVIELLAAQSTGYFIILCGIGMFAMTAVFQLVTLPVEFNASRRAMDDLSGFSAYGSEDLKASRKVLTAAALTYVAALFVTLVQVFRLVLIFGRRNNRR